MAGIPNRIFLRGVLPVRQERVVSADLPARRELESGASASLLTRFVKIFLVPGISWRISENKLPDDFIANHNIVLYFV